MGINETSRNLHRRRRLICHLVDKLRALRSAQRCGPETDSLGLIVKIPAENAGKIMQISRMTLGAHSGTAAIASAIDRR
jgi:hypothetical protein